MCGYVSNNVPTHPSLTLPRHPPTLQQLGPVVEPPTPIGDNKDDHTNDTPLAADADAPLQNEEDLVHEDDETPVGADRWTNKNVLAARKVVCIGVKYIILLCIFVHCCVITHLPSHHASRTTRHPSHATTTITG